MYLFALCWVIAGHAQCTPPHVDASFNTMTACYLAATWYNTKNGFHADQVECFHK